MSVTVEQLAAGYCVSLGALAEQGQPWRLQRFPNTVTVIEHPRHGITLFDTGYSRTSVEALRRWPAWPYGKLLPVTLPLGQAIVEQLASRGIAPSAVQRIICSHLHLDHLGGALDFPDAPVLMDAAEIAELRRNTGIKAVRHGVVPAIVPPMERLQAIEYAPAPPGLAPFEQAADLFGDGSLWLIPSPGHTPGSVAAVAVTTRGASLDGDGTGLTLLAGDVAWSRQGLLDGREPHPLARIAMHGVEQSRQTAARWRQWLAAHPHAQIVVSHDPQYLALLP